MSPDDLADKIAARGLALPALLLLESSRPLSFLGNQLLVFWRPLAQAVGLDGPAYRLCLELSEDRARLDDLVCRLEGRL